ncbi:MAG TPA: exodeoxyribonuclease VII large subunit [Acidobacteriaceae bacterium]|nr:exodeoxyribonuclease VII large subunit [Acidobacteriaceae bacterium]
MIPHESTHFTPQSLTQALSTAQIRLGDKAAYTISGTYRDRRGRKFGDTYYDRLEDGETQAQLTIRLARHLKVKLIDGHPCQVEGFITHKLTDNDGHLGIHLTFHVRSARRAWNEPPLDERERKSMYDEVLGLRIDKPRRNIDQVMESAFRRKGDKGTPRVALIVPDGGVAFNDVLKPLGWNSDNRYELSPHRISMSSKEAVISTLRELDRGKEYDVIALVRGGGAGLRLFNDEGIARALVALQTPVVTAIGHEDDKPLIEAVADRAFPTPTAFGNYLQQMKVNAKRELSWVSKERAGYEQKIRDLERQREAERTKSLGAIATLTHTVNELRADLHETFTQDTAQRGSGTFIFRIIAGLLVGVVVGAAGMLAAIRYTSVATLARPEPFHEEKQPAGGGQALPSPTPDGTQGQPTRPSPRDQQHRK